MLLLWVGKPKKRGTTTKTQAMAMGYGAIGWKQEQRSFYAYEKKILQTHTHVLESRGEILTEILA